MVYDPDPTVVALADRGLPHGGSPGQIVVKSGSAAYESEWAPNLGGSLYGMGATRPAQTGYVTVPTARGTSAAQPDYEYALAIWLEAGEQITEMAMAVTTGAAGSTIEVGLRNLSTWGSGNQPWPGTLITSAGVINGGTVATHTVPLAAPWTCPASGYYLACALVRGGAPQVRNTSGNPPVIRLAGLGLAGAVGSSVPSSVYAWVSMGGAPDGGLAVDAEHFNASISTAPLIVLKIG